MNQEISGYDDVFISLVELVYGEGLLSQGGESSIEAMLSEYQLDGLNALDVGSGLGMYDILLAQKNKINIIGIDPHPKMIEKSTELLQKFRSDLKGKVEFKKISCSNRLQSFQNGAFDLVFSKESILHIPLSEKKFFFQEVYRVLKSPGHLVLMDWMHQHSNYSENTKKMMELDKVNFALLTPQEYENLLVESGFKNIFYQDTTDLHASISGQNIQRIYAIKDQIIDRFGRDIFEASLQSWQLQEEAFKNKELLTGIFKAEKLSQ